MLTPIKYTDIKEQKLDLTFDELVAIEEAAETDATVRVWLKLFNAGDAKALQTLNVLVDKNLLAADRCIF